MKKSISAEDIEETILGEIINYPIVMKEVSMLLEVDSFTHSSRQVIFKACLQLYNSSAPLDLITVYSQVKKNGDEEKIGGPYYISQIMSKSIGAENAKFHAMVLAELNIRRKLNQIGSDVIEAANTESIDVFNSLAKLNKSLQSIQSFLEKNKVQESTEKIVEEIMSDVEYDVVEQGLSTGLKELDEKIHGLMAGYLILVAGRPGMGKTSFIKKLIIAAAVVAKKKVKVWSLEMTSKQLLIDLISILSGVDTTKIRNKQMTPEEKEKVKEAGKLLRNNLKIYPSGSSTWRKIRSEIEADPTDLAIVDYVQIMPHDPQDGRDANRDQQIGAISNGLAQTAKDNKIPIVLLSQLNREVERRNPPKPILSDLKDSGTLEANAVVVLFLYRPEYYDPKNPMENGVSLLGLAKIIIAKNRFGPLDDVLVRFIKERTAFEDYEQNQPQPVAEKVFYVNEKTDDIEPF